MGEKETSILIKNVLFVPAVLFFLVTIGCVTASHVQITMPPQRATEVELEVMKELKKFRGQIRKDIRVCVGNFWDKTGQHKDTERTRYSKALTQGGSDILYHMLYKALGPRVVVERDPENWGRLLNEYRYSYVKGPRTGTIQHGGPEGGLFGSNYMVTGGVVYYHADRYSGGGGLNIEGIGANFETYLSRVGMELRLVDMNSSEICWSTLVESWVSGRRVGIDLFRFVTAFGDEFLLQAESGVAQYLPADYAFETCMATAVVDMIKENEDIFITQMSAPKGAKRRPDAAKKAKEEAKPPSGQQKKREQQIMTDEKKDSKGPVPFWKQPSYRSPSPGSGQ